MIEDTDKAVAWATGIALATGGDWHVRLEEHPVPDHPTWLRELPETLHGASGSGHLRAGRRAAQHLLHQACVIATSAPGSLPRRWIRETFQELPGAAIAAAFTGPTSCLIGLRLNGQLPQDYLEITHRDGPPADPGSWVSAVYVLLIRVHAQHPASTGPPAALPGHLTMATTAGTTTLALQTHP